MNLIAGMRDAFVLRAEEVPDPRSVRPLRDRRDYQPARWDTTFYTVSDARYFLGTVGLVNSLRLCGHGHRIVVLDCGFTDRQRELLTPQCQLAPFSDGRAVNPCYYKLVAPLRDGDGTIAIIDSDVLVTGNLEELFAGASDGRIVAYPDPNRDRWYAEWREVFELPLPPRRQTYVNSGLVIFSTHWFPALMDQWWTACQKTLTQPTVAEGASGPSSQADQDALNAILMSRYSEDALELRPADEAPQARALRLGVTIGNRRTLSCHYRGCPARVLHAAGNPKPWISSEGIRKTAYVELLRDLLLRRDAPIRVPTDMIPLWLRAGVVPRAALAGLAWRTYRHSAVAAGEQLVARWMRAVQRRMM